MPPAAAEDPLLFVLDLFDELGITYMIGGSLASSIHGEPRATNDFDVVAEVAPSHVSALVAALERARFYASEDAVRDAIHRRASFNLIPARGAKIDVFVCPDREWDRVAMDRRVRVGYPGVPGREVAVRSAEDIILKKLEWFRLGGEVSERQWRDVRGVIRMRGAALDRPYLQRWAVVLGIADLLEAVLAESMP